MKLTKKQAAEELARRSLVNFARWVDPSVRMTRFHKRYYELLNDFAHGRIRRLIVSMPPQHGKSLGASVLLPAYLLGCDPGLRVVLASYNVRLASRFNRRVQRLMGGAAYGGVFPDSRLKTGNRGRAMRTSDEFEIEGHTGGMLSVGRGGSLTGNPVDVLILDDLYKDSMEANSPLIRDHVWEWYNAVAKTRMHNDTRELIVFTRWHEDDLVGRLMQHEPVVELHDPKQVADAASDAVWWHLNFEAIKRGAPTPLDPRNEGEALWPQRHSLALLERKRRLDPFLFETMYQGVPSVREGLLYGDRFKTYAERPTEPIRRANYTDTADTGSDYLCSVCYEVGADGVIYVTDVVYTALDMDRTEEMVADMLERNGTVEARVESNNGGRGFARAVARRCPGIHVEWFHQSHNKEARILSNAPAVLTQIVMPEGWHLRWSEFYGDLVTFRRLFRTNRHDDAPDVLTGIIETEAEMANRSGFCAYGFMQK